jgi:hypothetical protein
MRPVSARSRRDRLAMRNPDSVKNVETPRTPPLARWNPAWKAMTASTATARSPSSAGR